MRAPSTRCRLLVALLGVICMASVSATNDGATEGDSGEDAAYSGDNSTQDSESENDSTGDSYASTTETTTNTSTEETGNTDMAGTEEDTPNELGDLIDKLDKLTETIGNVHEDDKEANSTDVSEENRRAEDTPNTKEDDESSGDEKGNKNEDDPEDKKSGMEDDKNTTAGGEKCCYCEKSGEKDTAMDGVKEGLEMLIKKLDELIGGLADARKDREGKHADTEEDGNGGKNEECLSENEEVTDGITNNNVDDGLEDEILLPIHFNEPNLRNGRGESIPILPGRGGIIHPGPGRTGFGRGFNGNGGFRSGGFGNNGGGHSAAGRFGFVRAPFRG